MRKFSSQKKKIRNGRKKGLHVTPRENLESEIRRRKTDTRKGRVRKISHRSVDFRG